jgi:hypothetical protein
MRGSIIICISTSKYNSESVASSEPELKEHRKRPTYRTHDDLHHPLMPSIYINTVSVNYLARLNRNVHQSRESAFRDSGRG